MQPRTVLILLLAVLMIADAPIARAEIEAEEVRSAIDRGIDALKKSQGPKGGWADFLGYPGGVSCLCTLAMLNAGVQLDDEAMQRALSNLRNMKPENTYVVSLRLMALAAAEPKRDLLIIRRDAKWLVDNQVKGGPKAGCWGYPKGDGDNSNTQFALLALHEAERVGVPMSPKMWRIALDYWLKCQNQDGSWGYVMGDPSGSGSMTCAGIASVIIASGALSKGDAEFSGGRVKCCGEQLPNEAVERALEWMARNFTVNSNPAQGGRQAWLYYYLYGVERAGRMTANRFIGDHDWYREGAERLVRDQVQFANYWKGAGLAENNPDIATSLALLFLAKGRRPILVAKLKHGPEGDWDRHRSDLANLTAYVESKWKRDLTWQLIDPKRASVEDLLQSPVLFFNGKFAPQFTDEQKKRLRDYVDRGGFIFGEACCEGDAFEQGFHQLMAEIFPEAEYKLRLLPPEHPIWRAEQPVDPEYAKPLWGIDIGCRTSVVLCTKDLSCFWELARSGRETQFPPEVRQEIAAAETMGINILAYATNREVKYKEEVFNLTPENTPRDTFERGKLYIAKLKHPGGCNAAPTALSNLLRVAGEKKQIRVSTDAREVAMSDEKLFNYHLVFMHGRHSFRLTDQERKQLKVFLQNGGMLFADAICSSPEFTAAFEREMQAILPDKPLERIPATDPLFTPEFGGEDLALVSRRQPQAGDGPLKANIRKGEPFLEGIKLDDRYGVIFSRYDISCALENHESLECEGYTREDAARIGLNVLMYSLHQ
jgi:hypothetical protein